MHVLEYQEKSRSSFSYVKFDYDVNPPCMIMPSAVSKQTIQGDSKYL